MAVIKIVLNNSIVDDKNNCEGIKMTIYRF